MASTYSTLKFELIGTGEQAGTWGTTTNTNIGTAIQESIAGRATATFTSDADLTLSLTDSNATQVARNYILNVTSSVSLTATRNLIVPTINKPYIIENNTTGSQSIVVKTSAGTGVTVPNGKKVMVYADNTNVVAAFDTAPTLNVGSTSPASSVSLTVSATDAVLLPVGTTAQRPTAAAGLIRYNTTLGKFEGYTTAWGAIGGGATGAGGDSIFWENGQTVTTSYTITAGQNAGTFGPVTVNSGAIVTVPSGSVWTVV
jgi:hypothetical protein